jgi:hypothetical protein
MKLIFTAITLLLIVTSAMGAQTMRVDYYHTGDASQEVFSVDRVVIGRSCSSNRLIKPR